MEETGEGRPKRVVDILAFGDSLTKGYSSRKYHPYSNKLLDLLEEHFPKHIIKVTCTPVCFFTHLVIGWGRLNKQE